MAERMIPISNDQMFKHVFGRNKELCRKLIELSLDIPIASIEFIEPQRESKDIGRPGGTYFDVLATTQNGDFIDVEMQTEDDPGLLQRARLYLARMTKESWSRYVESKHDYDYSKMAQAAVIFICTFDPLGAGRRRYTGRMKYDGVNDMSDGAVSVLLNAGDVRNTEDEIPADLVAFLEYVAGASFIPGKSKFVDTVDREVVRANDDAVFREGLMDMDEKLWRSEKKGLEEGLKRGQDEGAQARQQQIVELAKRMTADGRQNEFLAILRDPQLLDTELKRYGIIK